MIEIVGGLTGERRRSFLDRNCLRVERMGLISATGSPFTVIVTFVPPETWRRTSAVWLRKSREAIVLMCAIVAHLPHRFVRANTS